MTTERPPAAPRRGPRSPVSFIAWGAVPGRSAEIAAALGGQARCFSGARLRGRLTPLRYLVTAVRTAAHLVRTRPGAVIATNPPVFNGLVCYGYCKVAGAPLLLDSHPTSFGAKGNRLAQVLLPLHRWLAVRAASTLVTTQEWVDVVETWGGRATIVHEAPQGARAQARPASAGRPQVLFVGTFASDEPTQEVLEAARSLPDVEVIVTGDLAKCPEALRASAPPNVTFPGFVPHAEYQELLDGADVVLTLTTEPTSVMRATYEAVYGLKPVIVTDWPALRELFPHALHVRNDGDAIAATIRQALEATPALLAAAPAARALQLDRWSHQLDELSDLIAGHPHLSGTTEKDRVSS